MNTATIKDRTDEMNAMALWIALYRIPARRKVGVLRLGNGWQASVACPYVISGKHDNPASAVAALLKLVEGK